jgi:hypothetical protein
MGAAPSPAKPAGVALKPKPKIKMAEGPKETVSAGNEPAVEQTLSKKVAAEETGPSGVLVGLNFLAAAAAVAFAALLYLIYAKPM